MRGTRLAKIEELAGLLVMKSPSQTLRVAIDGRTASGKTTFADELAKAIEAHGRPVIRSSIDGFHRPRSERYARGRYSAEGYYFDARNLSDICTHLLDPLGPNGNRIYATASFDLDADAPIELQPVLAAENAILIVDGTFLQRPELRDAFDVVIFLQTSEGLSQQRGMERDADKVGGLESARQLYESRYRPAFALYESVCDPIRQADVIVDNNDCENPTLTIGEHGALHQD